ncbi:MAG: hypothetical protein GY801_43830, partial [bacterium]|nr:hypothetical protein [bacterium]
MSPQCQTLRKKQAEQTRAPAFSEIAKILVHRLDSYPHDRGVDDLEPLMHAVTEQEAVQGNVEEGTGIPASLQRKLARCLYDTIDVLVERRVITSGETLARVIPQITSEIRAAGISDPALSHLYAAIYRAFRRRRSLLLLNLESQVRLEELPWVAAIERFRQKSLSTGELTRQTLEEVVTLTITSFPYTIIPNKLLQELRALSKGAELSLPLVDELAADIFMGEFSPKFLVAAKEAAELLEGTIYATYFGIDYADIRRISVKKRLSGSWSQRITADRFGQLCASRAGVSVRWGNPATNGMIIE